MHPRILKYPLAAVIAAIPAYYLGRISASEPPQAAPGRPAPATVSRPQRARPAPSYPEELHRIALSRASERDDAAHHAMLLEWAAIDPVAAMEYARKTLTNDDLAQAMSGIVKAWATVDPDAAWQWALTLGPAEIHHAHTVLEEIGRNDPAKAAALGSDFAAGHPTEAAAMCLTTLRGIAYGGNFELVKSFAATAPLANPGERGMLYNYAAGLWAPFDADAASQWVLALPEESRAQALIGLGEAWAEQDPPAAAGFAVNLPPGESRRTALKQAITNWVQTQPEAASAWINGFEPHPDFDEAMASVATLRFLVEQNTELSLDWAAHISDAALRDGTIGEIVSGWSLRDPAAALLYLRDAPGLTPEVRQRLDAQIRESAKVTNR